MNNLKKEYELLKKYNIENEKELENLKNNKFVKRFLELTDEKSKIKSKLTDLYKNIRINEFSTCNHILVLTNIDCDPIEGRTQKYYGCIKCGLDEKVLRDYFWKSSLNGDQKIMFDYLCNHNLNNGINTGIYCDLRLAKKIYSSIKKEYPNIDDEEALKHFEIEVDHKKIKKITY